MGLQPRVAEVQGPDHIINITKYIFPITINHQILSSMVVLVLVYIPRSIFEYLITVTGPYLLLVFLVEPRTFLLVLSVIIGYF